MKCKISIVIPVYNAEKTLRRCIDSVIEQPFISWELILVDDGSTDSSGHICDEYAAKDNRIYVIHKKNEGVSIARNTALDIAQGEYITFIDSDDYIQGNVFSLVESATCDLLVFESISYRIDGSIKEWYHIEDRKYCKKNVNNFIYNNITNLVLDGPCAKFFRKTTVGDNRFPAGQRLGEDNVFMLSFIRGCETIVTAKGAYYIVEDHGAQYVAKYRMSAEESSVCFENIMVCYSKLGIRNTIFEQSMFSTFYGIINPNEKKTDWYKNKMVKKYVRILRYFPNSNIRDYYYQDKYPFLFLIYSTIRKLYHKFK